MVPLWMFKIYYEKIELKCLVALLKNDFKETFIKKKKKYFSPKMFIVLTR